MNNKLTFEEGMEKLEALVKRMESGDMPLNESIECYREAMEIYKALGKLLDEGEARITELEKSMDKDIRDEIIG